MDRDDLDAVAECWAAAVDCVLWGKSDGLLEGVVYPLVGHLLDTAAVAWCGWDLHLVERQRRAVLRGMGLDPESPADRERARALVAVWAGWHDLGKIGHFQRKDPSAYGRLTGYPPSAGEKLSHGEVTHLLLASALPDTGYDAMGDGLALASVARRVAQLLGGHHGRYFTQPSPRSLRHSVVREQPMGAGKWQEQRLAHLGAVWSAVGEPVAPGVLSVEAAVVVGELVVLSDWLASQEHFVSAQLEGWRLAGDGALVGHWGRALAGAPALLVGAGLGVPVWTETPLS
ncbi:CRISPR-associated endonuclease Cas3'' [Kitasatospora sp. NPDC002040]|uniref:CRISPR-associated endonuclease Cas3'' n=1 Tax=Kitasatospora sp. NPDC002040 TaxID=3154661 RepID=UPI00331DC446